MCWEEEPDLVKHIVDTDAHRKRSEVLLADVAVLGDHGTAVIRALGSRVTGMLRDRKRGTRVGWLGTGLSP